MSNNKKITRREFIKDSSLASFGGALILGLPGCSQKHIPPGSPHSNTPAPSIPSPWVNVEGKNSDVVLVRNASALDEKGKAVYETILKMLDAGIIALTGSKDAVSGWKKIIHPEDIVGIKTNVWRYLPTPPQVEQAIKTRVMTVGVPGENIGIADRGIYRDSFFARTTALINTRPMRSHHWSGVGSCIKNMITFAPVPSTYHNDSCADLAKLWQLPLVKDKVRLNVLVMLTPQFHGIGPHSFNPKYVWNYYGLIVGFDPVAVDATGARILQAKRREFFGEERPLNPPPKHIFLADTRHGLGKADPAKINLIKIGYDKEILI